MLKEVRAACCAVASHVINFPRQELRDLESIMPNPAIAPTYDNHHINPQSQWARRSADTPMSRRFSLGRGATTVWHCTPSIPQHEGDA